MSFASIKNFEPIRDDYLFFQEHSTEAREDIFAYLPQLKAIAKENGTIHMMDFGCGSGSFTRQFLMQAGWPPKQLRISLVEPDAVSRQQALKQLQDFTLEPIQSWPILTLNQKDRFDFILANHVLYYVPDLDEVLASLLRASTPSGILLTAMAGHRNVLIQFLYSCFDLINMPFPFHIAEDLQASLLRHSIVCHKKDVTYGLVFPDSEDHRLTIMRFLLGEYFSEVPRQAMLDLFNPYADDGQIAIQTVHEQFAIQHR